MLEIRGASESVRAAANEIAAASSDLSSRTESEAASLQQTAASMEQISGTVDRSAAAVLAADQRSGIATQMAFRDGEVVADAVGTMNEIEAASDRIGAIISVIDGIAFQTNILALHAAVEAARAGDQGRGFGVVAHEVRSLAQRSAQAAREVKQLVEEAVSRVEAALVHQAGETMGKIVAGAADVRSVVSGMRVRRPSRHAVSRRLIEHSCSSTKWSRRTWRWWRSWQLHLPLCRHRQMRWRRTLADSQ